MGKQGPCCHCGITTTPLWRNGPPEKPVLCNACGSRWRTKGTLVNYTPTHSLSKEPCSNSDDFEFKPKPVKFGMKPKPIKFKNSHHSEDFEIKPEPVKFKKLYNSEDIEIKPKPVKFKNPHHSDDFEIKSKPFKYKNLYNSEDFEIKPKPVKFENLHDSEDFEIKPKPVKFKNLYKKDVKKEGSSSGSFRRVVERESREESSCSDSSVRNDLAGNTWVSLVPSKKRTYVSPPSPKKPSHVLQLTHDLRSILHQEKNNKSSKNLLCLEEDYNCDLVYKRDTLDEFGYGSVLIKNKDENKGDNLDIVKRDKVGNDKLQIMRGQDSPLVALNLLDLVNYESFMKNLNHEEQQNLFKYLPSIDINNPPDSLKTLFSSKSFIEAFSQFKDKITSGSTCPISNKRPRDCQNHIYTELKGDKRSPKRVCKSPQDKNSQFLKKQGVSCLIPVPLLYLQDNSENDLIMDVPRNAPSPEAELLHNGPFKIKCLANRSSVFVDSEINGESSCSSHTTK